MARLYANENFTRNVVAALNRLGHDVISTYELGKANQKIPDGEVLKTVIAQDRAVLTFNRKDFIKLHRNDANHAGIVICKEILDVELMAALIHEALEQTDKLVRQLIRVNRKGL